MGHDCCRYLCPKTAGGHGVTSPAVRVWERIGGESLGPLSCSSACAPTVRDSVCLMLLPHAQTYWSGTSYMGETTGAFFSHAIKFSLDYHDQNPRYQPLSVYQQYPGAWRLRATWTARLVVSPLGPCLDCWSSSCPPALPHACDPVWLACEGAPWIILTHETPRGGRTRNANHAGPSKAENG